MGNHFENRLHELILSGLPTEELQEALGNYHYSDIADALEALDADTRQEVYTVLGIEDVAQIFAYYENAESFIEELSPEYAADVLEEMDSSDAVDILDELDKEDREAIFGLMEADAREAVEKLDSYGENTIGAYMSDNYITLSSTSSVKSAMSRMVKQAGEHDNIYMLYITDKAGRYCGAISLKDLITARVDDNFSSLIMSSYPFFYDDELMSDCIERLKDYGEGSVPVLNRAGELIGAVTGDAVIEAAESEFEEDYARLGGLTEEEEATEPPLRSVKKRLPWLIVLLFMGLAVSGVIGVFEGVIAALPTIVFFQTMILGMAGNAGTQSLAVTIRALAGIKSSRGQKRGILKELLVGFLNGIIMGVLAAVVVAVFLFITQQEIISGNGYVFSDTLMVGGVIGISMLLSITLSALIGASMPMLLCKIGVDPAVASGPFITTLNDITAVAVYYGLSFAAFASFL